MRIFWHERISYGPALWVREEAPGEVDDGVHGLASGEVTAVVEKSVVAAAHYSILLQHQFTVVLV